MNLALIKTAIKKDTQHKLTLKTNNLFHFFDCLI